MRRLGVLLLVLMAMLAMATSALADVEGGSSVSLSTVLPDVPGSDTATVTLTLEGTTSFESTPTDVYLMLEDSGSISDSEWDTIIKTMIIPTINGLVAEGLFDNGGRLGVGTYAGPSNQDPTAAQCLSQYGQPCWQVFVRPLNQLGPARPAPSAPPSVT